ncbi:metallophosphoesterase [Lysobacter korlensis]|uniref:Metallophosphoesterase n=1 Tax=Lysobacter korlensis TaxID=553636 RepID=A0ABV6RQI7_9GAMM
MFFAQIGSAAVVVMTSALLAGCTAPEPDAGNRSGTTGPRATCSPAPPSAALRFTAAGDYSFSPEAEAVLGCIGQSQPDLHLAVGDLSYGEAGEEHLWCDFVTQHVGEDLPFELLAGNHEGDGRNGLIDEFADCLPNRLPGLQGEYGGQYFVDVPENDPLVRFVLISPAIAFADGVWDYGADTERFEWTQAAITGARDVGIPWVVAGMHKPCHSIGDHPCEPGAAITNLLVDSGVDLVLSAHEHIYQRTHQLQTGERCPHLPADAFEPGCLADDDAEMLAGKGTVFVTVGTGGAPLHDVNPSDPDAGYFAVASGANRDPAWGFVEVDADETGLSVSFRPVIGSFEDAFAITSGGGR